MIRVPLLVIALGIVFFGFAAPFLIYGTAGLAIGAGAILIGSVAFWLVEKKTAHRLKDDNAWNIVMKAGGGQDGLFSPPGSDDSGSRDHAEQPAYRGGERHREHAPEGNAHGPAN